MTKSTFLKSTLILTVAAFISKFIGSAFRIPLQNIAGDEVLGIFSLVYPIYMVALILSVAGIPLAISKLIAELNIKNDSFAVKEIYITARILAIIFGVCSFIIIYAFSSQIANLLGGPKTELALIIVAATLLFAPYMAVYRGFFQGHGEMDPTAISQVIEQFVRAGLILAIAYYLVTRNYSNEIIAGFIMMGSVAGAIASLIYLKWKFSQTDFKFSRQNKYSLSIFFSYSKKILSISIPIAIGAITMALLNFVDSFTISYGLRSSGVEMNDVNYFYGIYGRGLSISQLATVFATSIVLPLVPLISSKLAEKDRSGIRVIIEKVHRMTHLISWPAAIGLVALTLPMNLALFTNLEGSLLIAILTFSSGFASLSILGTGILQGTKFVKISALIILVAVLLKAIINIILIQYLGLEGAAISTLIVYIFIFMINTIYIYKYFKFTIVTSNIVKIISSSFLMGIIIGIPTVYLNFNNWNRVESFAYLCIAILVGAILYFSLLLLFKVLSKKDLPIIKNNLMK